MNGKAQKQTIQWPPLLQMMHDEPVVDPTFRNVEKNNAPYINDMLAPVWIKNTGKKSIYDKDGNEYEINNGYLTRNGLELFEINNKKFVKEDVTEQLVNYHDYDFTDKYTAFSVWDSDDNSFIITFNNHAVKYRSLYEDGVVVATRLRVIDTYCFFVVYYDIGDVGYVDIYSQDTQGVNRVFTKRVRWFRQQIRRNSTDEPIYQEFTLENASPIINIGRYQVNQFGFTLISSYGKALNTARNYFATFFLDSPNGILYQLGVDAKPNSQTSEITVENEYQQSFRLVSQFSNEQKVLSLISDDNGATYYNYTNGEKGTVVNIPSTYFPTDSGRTVTIDEVEYKIYTAQGVEYTATLNLACSDATQTIQLKATGNYNGEETEEYTSNQGTGTQSISEKILIFRGQEAPHWSWTKVKVYWINAWSTVLDWNNGKYFTVSRREQSLVESGWLVSPNIVIDDGTLYSMWYIQHVYSEGNNWNNQSLTTGNIIEESGRIGSYAVIDGVYTYTIIPTEYVTITSNNQVARSNSVVFNQNIAIDTVKMNNTAATSSYSLYNNGGTAGNESTSSVFLEYSNSNATDLRYYPGTTRDSSFNYFGDQKFNGDTVVGNVEDQPVYVVQGYRTPVHTKSLWSVFDNYTTPFNILYNTDAAGTCLPQGISYSDDSESMGTLLTPWESIDDDFYIAANSTSVVYRDKSNRYYKITIEDGNDLIAVLDDRYILVNTTSYWNMFDSVLLKKFHYATDYNDRLMFGQTAVPTNYFSGANSSGATTYSRYTATAINASYSIMPMYAVSSILLPRTIRLRVLINAEKTFRCLTNESSDTQPIDVYFGDIGTLNAKYRYSIYPYAITDRVLKFDLVDSTYTISSNTYYSPNIFTEYINGAGNNDMVKENYSTFVLQYYDNTPFFLYSSSSETSARFGDNIYFFVLQGQFYSFMNEKIYSMIYTNGSISQQEAIVDCRGMKFIGNNSMIAFFWSPRNRAIYSFTGDANLQHLYNGNKFTRMGYEGNIVKHWYDETTQSIYADTDRGLLVFGPKNTYLFENLKNVTNCQFSNDSISHITSDDIVYNLTYYETEGYEILPLDLETSFYGLGDNEYTSIDRWDIVLFDGTGKKPSSECTVGVRSITDITVKSEEKTFKITPDMWDKWSSSILLRFVPKLQKGQGLRLYVKTPMIIQRIVPHIMDMGTGTATRRGV